MTGVLTRCYRCGKLANTSRPCKVCESEQHMEPVELTDSLPRISLEDRKAYAATVPWVRRLRRPTSCQGWMPRGTCKKTAEWSYRRLRRTRWEGWLVAPNEPTWRHLCWVHLTSSGFCANMSEESRWEKFQTENPPPWWTPERQALIDELNRRAETGQ